MNLGGLSDEHTFIMIPKYELLYFSRPADMKVLSERPEHLDSLPHEPEKFYNSGNLVLYV
jgi:hypothetical protein